MNHVNNQEDDIKDEFAHKILNSNSCSILNISYKFIKIYSNSLTDIFEEEKNYLKQRCYSSDLSSSIKKSLEKKLRLNTINNNNNLFKKNYNSNSTEKRKSSSYMNKEIDDNENLDLLVSNTKLSSNLDEEKGSNLITNKAVKICSNIKKIVKSTPKSIINVSSCESEKTIFFTNSKSKIKNKDKDIKKELSNFNLDEISENATFSKKENKQNSIKGNKIKKNNTIEIQKKHINSDDYKTSNENFIESTSSNTKPNNNKETKNILIKKNQDSIFNPKEKKTHKSSSMTITSNRSSIDYQNFNNLLNKEEDNNKNDLNLIIGQSDKIKPQVKNNIVKNLKSNYFTLNIKSKEINNKNDNLKNEKNTKNKNFITKKSIVTNKAELKSNVKKPNINSNFGNYNSVAPRSGKSNKGNINISNISEFDLAGESNYQTDGQHGASMKIEINKKTKEKNSSEILTKSNNKTQKTNPFKNQILNKSTNITLDKKSANIYEEKQASLMSTKSKINYNTTNSNYTSGSKTTRNKDLNEIQTMKKFRTSNLFNKAASMPKNTNMNQIKELKNESTNQEEKQKDIKVNIEEFYCKNMDFLENRKKTLAVKREEYLKKELEEIQEIPIINKNSKKIADRDTNDFYTRVTKFSDKIKTEKKQKIEEKEKKEIELFEKNQEKYKGKCVDLKLKYEQFVQWKSKKNESIIEKQNNEIETQIKKCSFKPEINNNSKKISSIKRLYNSNYGENLDIVSRLYKEDPLKRKHKSDILTNIYTSTFSPITHKNKFKFSLNNENYLNQLNNSLNFNTTCHTITNFKTGFNSINQKGVKDRYKTNRENNDSIYDQFKKINIDNMRKFKSVNRYSDSLENSEFKRNIINNLNQNKSNKLSSSFHSGEENYHNEFLTEANGNSRDFGNILKKKFENIFKKYNMN